MTTSTPDALIALIAAGQHGLFTRAQALRCGILRGGIDWRVATGRWKRVRHRVYRLSGAPHSWRQDALAACLSLGPGAVVSHRAALALRSRPKRAPRIEITIPRAQHRGHLPGVVLHRPRAAVPPEDVTVIDAVPVTKPARTLLDIAGKEPSDAVAILLDDALRRGLVTLDWMSVWLNAQPGKRRGHRTLRELVAERAAAGITESPLEAKALALLRGAGLPAPELQHVVTGGGRFVARLDLAWPERLVAVEADGFRFHDRRDRFDGERARGNELGALGWRVLRVTSEHLRTDPDGVVEWVRRALGTAPQ